MGARAVRAPPLCATIPRFGASLAATAMATIETIDGDPFDSSPVIVEKIALKDGEEAPIGREARGQPGVMS